MSGGAGHACALAAFALLPAAAQAVTYAVVPLIGHQLTVVNAEPVTSAAVDRNKYQTAPIGDDVFDNAIRAAVDRAVRARRADDATLLVHATVPTGEIPDELVTKVIEAVAPKALEAGAERLVVVAPYRAAPMLNTRDGHTGTGRVAGIGLYVNRFQPLTIAGTQQSAFGFLGLFANFRVSIIDARTHAVLAEDIATTGTTLSAARADDSNPLNTLTNEQKIARLQSLMRNEIGRILPPLLERAGP